MFCKEPFSRCKFFVAREYGARVNNNYDFVMRRVKRSLEALERIETDADYDFWKSPVFASSFCPQSANGSLLAAANEIGQVIFWNLSASSYKKDHAVNNAHNNAIFDMAWSPNDLKMITASGDKSVVMWNCGHDLKLRKVNTFTGHTATAKTCAWSPDNTDMLCTGDRSGVVFVWDTRSGKPENCINNAHERARYWKVGKKPRVENTSVTGIVFYQPYYLITAAAATQKIRMWDLRKYYAAYSRSPQPVCEFSNNKYEDQSGYSYLTIDRARHRLYASSVYDKIYSFALNTPDVSPAAVFTGGILRSFYSRCCLSPDGKYLLSGSSTEYAVLWNTSENLGGDVTPVRKVVTSGIEVNTVAWCKSSGDTLKIAAFPEGEPCEIFDINPSNISTDLWDCGPQESENKKFKQKVSQELPPTIQCIKKSRFITTLPGPLNKSEMTSPTLNNRTQSDLFCSAGQNRKRVLQEMLENDSEDRQNKKIKLRGRLSPRRLFISSSITDENCDTISVLSRVTNRFDVNDKDSLASASSSELGSCNQDDDRNSGEFTASNACVKTPFSPTSNLPNHVVDGTSPSHVCKSSQKKRLDWLTELRHGKVSDLENNGPRKLIESNSRKNEHSKKLHKKGHESILKFFRVLGKPTDEQLKSSPGCRVVSNNQSS